MGSVVFVDDAYIAGVTALRSVNLSEVNFMVDMDGEDNALTSQKARSCVFSPVDLLFRGMTGRQQNSLRLFYFLPVNLSFVAASAALGVSFPGACPGKDESLF